MKFNVYVVFDKKVEEFSSPFIQRPGAVVRSVENIVKQSPISPKDLVLYELCSFDSETGKFFDKASNFSFCEPDEVGCLYDLLSDYDGGKSE